MLLALSLGRWPLVLELLHTRCAAPALAALFLDACPAAAAETPALAAAVRGAAAAWYTKAMHPRMAQFYRGEPAPAEAGPE